MIDPSQIARAAGGFPGPAAPGEIVSIFGQGIGPETALGARLVSGRVVALFATAPVSRRRRA